jgi:hypothetical protein
LLANRDRARDEIAEADHDHVLRTIRSIASEWVRLTHRQQLLGLAVHFLQREDDTASFCALSCPFSWVPGRITRICVSGSLARIRLQMYRAWARPPG